MSFQAQHVFDRVRNHLNDRDFTRWPLTELKDYLNDGLREITAVAPRAVSDIVVIALDPGSLQDVPDTCTRILRVNANVSSNQASRLRKSTVRPTTRAQLDAVLKGWEDPTVFPPTLEVIHYVEDPNMNGEFLVWPPNTGAGFLEVVAARRPSLVTTPDTSPNLLSSWSETVDLDDRYFTALVDYVMYAALLKDIAVAANAARAQAHYQGFLTKLGVGVQSQAEGAATAATGE